MLLLNILEGLDGGLQGGPHFTGCVVLVSSAEVGRAAKFSEVKRSEVLGVGSSFDHRNQPFGRFVQHLLALGSGKFLPLEIAVNISKKESELTMSLKRSMPPLCMKVWRPKTKGWLLVVATGGLYAARMCAKMVLEDTLAHRERKTGSLSLKCKN
jgi:hypothetical protein